MKKYIGTKTVNAKPMTRLEFRKFRNYEMPEDESVDAEGYLVEYTDGGEPNTSEYKGYVSWSPKDVFEKSYRSIETPKERVIVEKSELEEKLAKLEAFLLTDVFEGLDDTDKSLLVNQKAHMLGYSRALALRVDRL